ncbi:hypothetical protein ACOMHN_007555 [Nucella lapillus]
MGCSREFLFRNLEVRSPPHSQWDWLGRSLEPRAVHRPPLLHGQLPLQAVVCPPWRVSLLQCSLPSSPLVQRRP